MAEVRVRALLKRPFCELPVAGDLPRLCNRMQVFVQNEKNDENDAGPCITLNEASDDDEEFVGVMKKEKEGKMVYCTDSPKRENLRTLLSVLSSYLEPDVKRDVEAEFDEFFPPTAEISGLLQRFLEEKFGGNDSKVVRVIKACNQAIIAPIIIELKTQLGVENMTKDVAKSWTTKIFVEKDVILVCTYKREQHLQNNFQYEWELILTFDRKEIECTDIKVRVTDLMFHERLHAKETKKKEQVKAILGQLCIVEPQVLRESDTKTWEFYQNNDTMGEREKGEEKERQTNEELEEEEEEETEGTNKDDSSKEDRRLDISLENNPVWWLFLISSFTVLGGLLLFFK